MDICRLLEIESEKLLKIIHSIKRKDADIDKYRKLFIGQKIKAIDSVSTVDEGLMIVFENNSSLCFRFNECEGDIFIVPDSVMIARELSESL